MLRCKSRGYLKPIFRNHSQYIHSQAASISWAAQCVYLAVFASVEGEVRLVGRRVRCVVLQLLLLCVMSYHWVVLWLFC
jgi:hypothetical protein